MPVKHVKHHTKVFSLKKYQTFSSKSPPLTQLNGQKGRCPESKPVTGTTFLTLNPAVHDFPATFKDEKKSWLQTDIKQSLHGRQIHRKSLHSKHIAKKGSYGDIGTRLVLKKQTFKGVGAFGGYQYLIKSKCASKYLKLERGGWVGKRFQKRLAKNDWIPLNKYSWHDALRKAHRHWEGQK